jgi:hypothetical protein
MKVRGSGSKVWSVAMAMVIFSVFWSAAPALGAAPGEPKPLRLEVESYAKDFGVSKAEAERRLEVQLEGAGIVGQLRRTLDENYAGVWFDNETGEFVVPVIGDRGRSEAAAELTRAGLAGDFRTHPVEATWGELEAAQRRLDRRLRDLIEANLVQTSRDPIANALVAHESEGASEAVAATIRRAIEGLGVEVEIRREAADRFNAVPAACNEPVRVCDRPLRGGVKIEPLSGGWCSAGFKAIGKTFANRFMLTAGHCSKGTGAWRSRDSANVPREMGIAEESVFPGRDYGKIKVNGYGTYWDQEPWPTQVAHWGVNHSSGISWEGWNYLGQHVCHSGATSGSSCGWVQTIGKTVNYPEGAVGNLVEVEGPSYCVMGGDSGGPIFAGNVALGLMSGRLEENPCSKVGYHAEITEATTALGVTVAPRIGKPARPEELGFLRYNSPGNTSLRTYTGAPKFQTLASSAPTGYPAISDPQNIQGLTIDWNGDGIDGIGFLRYNYPGNTFLDTYTNPPTYQLLASHSTTGYPAISDPQNIQGLTIDWNGDGVDELGFLRYNYPGNTFLDTYTNPPNYQLLASHSTTGYPSISDPQNVQALAIDWTGDGIDELGFVRLNHFTGNAHLDTYVGAPNYKVLASSCDTGYPAIKDPQNVQVLAIDWTGDGVDELGFLRYNPKTGATHLDTYVGAPCYQTLASSSLTGYPEVFDPQNVQALALNTG